MATLILTALSTELSIDAYIYATESTSQSVPNIVLILADDLGYADVGFQGSTDILTPELDQLAKQGTTFSSAYVVHPFCGPSRMALLSGRYPYEFGAPFNLPDHSTRRYTDQGITTEETLISTVLKDAGYRTGIMGKWHLGQQAEFHPNNRGFDDFFGFLGGGILYFGPYRANNNAGNVWDYKRFPEHNGVDVTTLTENDYMTDVLSREGVRFIKESATTKDPFFLFMSYNAPHTVLAATEEDLAKFPNLAGKRQTYAAMVYALDRGVGELVDALKASGKYDNTLIVFLSDNGGRTDQGASNHPLQGGKGDTTEGGYRTPMFFHWPQVIKPDQRYDHPVTALDFYPTFARLAGAQIPADKQLDGKDIWDAFLAGRSARQGELIYTVRHHNADSNVGARRDEWKVCRTAGGWKLFNITKDIGEQHDLSAKHPEILSQLVAEVRQMCESHTQPLWFDNDKQAAEWKDSGMPNYDKTFKLD
ncbi:MAG: sulfatase-like hydrolase/transferase [Planctomycetaceae bacterium]|nr:sulfatase-like hydrolase/transferase [Planctomycetaceae bacterium]